MNTEKTGVMSLNTDNVKATVPMQITKKMNGCTVILRFTTDKNEQVSSTIRDLLIKSYAEKLFSQNM